MADIELEELLNESPKSASPIEKNVSVALFRQTDKPEQGDIHLDPWLKHKYKRSKSVEQIETLATSTGDQSSNKAKQALETDGELTRKISFDNWKKIGLPNYVEEDYEQLKIKTTFKPVPIEDHCRKYSSKR